MLTDSHIMGNTEREDSMADEMTVTEAARWLGVSRSKIWALLREGTLEAHQNPLDKREKLITLAALRKLKGQSQTPLDGRPTSRLRSVGAGSNRDVNSDEIEDYLREHWRRS
jgi:hypothetical protein